MISPYPLANEIGANITVTPAARAFGCRMRGVGEHVRTLHYRFYASMQSAAFAGEVVLILNQEKRCRLRIDRHILLTPSEWPSGLHSGECSLDQNDTIR